LSDLLLAVDLMEPYVSSVTYDSPLSLVKESLNRYNIEYLAVVSKENTIEGFIEARTLNKIISTKIIELQRKADSLENQGLQPKLS